MATQSGRKSRARGVETVGASPGQLCMCKERVGFPIDVGSRVFEASRVFVRGACEWTINRFLGGGPNYSCKDKRGNLVATLEIHV
jgi:hypothetical protein